MQGENWLKMDASLELKNVGQKCNNEQLMHHAEILNKRVESLQVSVYFQ